LDVLLVWLLLSSNYFARKNNHTQVGNFNESKQLILSTNEVLELTLYVRASTKIAAGKQKYLTRTKQIFNKIPDFDSGRQQLPKN